VTLKVRGIVRLILISLALVILAGIVIGVWLETGRLNNIFSSSDPPKAGLALAGFELDDLEGNRFLSSDLTGKRVIINFWATWCAPCIEELPLFEEIHKQNQSDLLVIGINVNEPHEVVQSFVEEMGISFTVLLDTDGALSDMYRVWGYPTTFFVNADGTLAATHTGPLSRSELQRYINSMEPSP